MSRFISNPSTYRNRKEKLMNPKILYHWINELASHLPSLNGWQAVSIGLFSYGVVLAGSSRQRAIARQIVCGEKTLSAVKRLQRLLGNQRWCIETFFAEWSQWMLSRLKTQRIDLLVDETKLKDRLGVMMVGVAFEGRCIPLAWRCYRANSRADYPAEGQAAMIASLLRLIQAGLPADKTARVLADRGIGTSPRLCQTIDDMGWLYLFRITKQSKIVTSTGEWTIYDQAQPGKVWRASGQVFKKRGRIPAHVCAIWDKGCDEPWLLVTNDPNCNGCDYAQRSWQEQSFRDLKRGGWQWTQSGVRCRRRMTRLLVILVVAYAWMISWGCHAVERDQASRLIRDGAGGWRRQWSLFREGWRFFCDAVIRKGIFLELRFVADKRLA